MAKSIYISAGMLAALALTAAATKGPTTYVVRSRYNDDARIKEPKLWRVKDFTPKPYGKKHRRYNK